MSPGVNGNCEEVSECVRAVVRSRIQATKQATEIANTDLQCSYGKLCSQAQSVVLPMEPEGSLEIAGSRHQESTGPLEQILCIITPGHSITGPFVSTSRCTVTKFSAMSPFAWVRRSRTFSQCASPFSMEKVGSFRSK